jgi:hypothetical protein
MSLTTHNSSADVIPFQPVNRPEHKSRFAQAREAWLRQWQADDRLTHADRALVTQIFAHFNQRHFQETGELLAWPSWETITTQARLSEPSIRRGLKKLEHVGALKIIRGGRDPKTGWKLKNEYYAVCSPPVGVTGGHPSGFSKSTRQDDGKGPSAPKLVPYQSKFGGGILMLPEQSVQKLEAIKKRQRLNGRRPP